MCKRRGSRMEDSKEVLKTRLAAPGAAEKERTVPESDAKDTSGTVTGKRERAFPIKRRSSDAG